MYRLLIHKGEDLILDRVIDADTVIELMRPTVALGGVPQESRTTEEDEVDITGKKVRRCGKCGKGGHRADKCGLKKK